MLFLICVLALWNSQKPIEASFPKKQMETRVPQKPIDEADVPQKPIVLQKQMEADVPQKPVSVKILNLRKGELVHIKGNNSIVSINYKVIHVVYGLWNDGSSIDMKFLDVWKSKHPDWKLIIHDKLESENLIKTEFSWLKDLYYSSPNIQRADLLRLLYVYKYGGLYIDIDVWCEGNLEQSFAKWGYNESKHKLVGFIETIIPHGELMNQKMSIRNGIHEINTRIANYIFYASPKSKPLLAIIFRVASRIQRWQSMSEDQREIIAKADGKDYITLFITGPDAFTEAVFGGPDASLLDGVLVLPFDESEKYRNDNRGTWRGGRDNI